jgi:hypothetical protein
MATNTMIYLAVDKDGTEMIYGMPPKKNQELGWWYHQESCFELPTGTIEKLTGKPLTWEDGYMTYVGDNYDPTPNE